MKIGVLIKQVPGTESSLRVTQDENWVVEDSINFEINESDSYALEEALQIKEKIGDSEVVAISMGPTERTPKVIREALSKGADRGVYIEEPLPYEKDPFVVAGIFAEALKDEAFDLIFSGTQSDDLGSGQTGVVLGELLGMSTVTLAMETDLQDDKIRIKRELESGWFQWVTLPLPASVSVQSGINQPRYPSLKGIMSAKRKEIKPVEKASLNVPDPLQIMKRVYIQHTDKRTEMIEGSVDDIVARLIDVLKTEAKVL